MFELIRDFDEGYELLKEAFPISEIRPYEKVKYICDHNIAQMYGYYDEKLKGVIILWENEEFVMIENFAVDKNCRGEGIGSIMLKEVANKFQDKTIFLEVEEPYDGISERRIGFYERNNFILSEFAYLQPQISDEVNKVPLILMSYNKVLTHEMFIKMKPFIYNVIYAKY